MIITKTPLRIGFAGGGSDLPTFTEKYTGWCVNATIDKYVYVLVKKRHDDKVYLKYSENEVVEDVNNIKHDFIRETLKFLEIDYGIEVINFADIPTKGTGLGSSSSFLVGLLNALHILKGTPVGPQELAEQACYIEIDKCEKPIGFQDQFAAAYGGLNTMIFGKDQYSTRVTKIKCDDKQLSEISDSLQMFYTGITRSSSDILSEQGKNLKTKNTSALMIENVRIAQQLSIELANNNYGAIAKALQDNWSLKKQFASSISNNEIDDMVEIALHSGAAAAKVTGAGGGGFLLLYTPQHRRLEVTENMKLEFPNAIHMPMKLDKYGTRVLLNTEEYQWG